MFLPSRTSGLSPHTAKIIIPTAAANLMTSGLPCRRLNDLQTQTFDLRNPTRTKAKHWRAL